MPQSTRRQFRETLKPGAAMLLPGVANALAARIVADQGFDAAYITGQTIYVDGGRLVLNMIMPDKD